MSELPSLEKFNQTGKGAVAICNAYASGRLFDREAIDYEAAAQRLSTLIYESPESSFPGEFLPYARVESRSIVDAALGTGG
jgi:hypothetical protein